MFSLLSSSILGLIAGLLSTLAPCVLPLLPILAGAALSTHRYGPWALAAGLALSYATTGLLLASIGGSGFISADLLRNFSALLLIAFGAVMLSVHLQHEFARLTANLGGVSQPWLQRINSDSLSGQFLLGAVLGVAWSPCVGPTLGAAITLASQGGNWPQAAITMAMFGVGAALPLVVFGTLSQQALQRYKQRLTAAGKTGKEILGAILLVLGILIFSGLDKSFEIWVLNHAPTWLANLSVAV
ncbi:MAG: cytochrome c biogenesis CcdA family protein [Methylomonas sp.]|jgi:cytochrome c biogenesis protein CcdA